MQETDTKITVSSINDINSFNLERIITVKGVIENMSKAEAQISAKLRQSYENDLQAMAPQTMMFPGLHPMAMMATAGRWTPFQDLVLLILSVWVARVTVLTGVCGGTNTYISYRNLPIDIDWVNLRRNTLRVELFVL